MLSYNIIYKNRDKYQF